MKIRCRDLPGPAGNYVAFPDGLRDLDDDAAAEALAQNGMMLALGADRSQRLIAEGIERAERPRSSSDETHVATPAES